jgi:parallel beta-helix repeat protein
MSRRKWFAVPLAGLLVAGGFTLPARANHVLGCGDVITQSTVLHNDIGPCQGDGLVVDASGITLNLNGHTIFGNGGLVVTHQAAAVRILNEFHVVVTNGTVRDFYHGVRVTQGGHNRVSRLTVQDNTGGNGIVLENSADNVVSSNLVTGNGRFSGISTFDSVNLPAGSARNTIANNVLRLNNASSSTPGIAVENGPGHVVRGNLVETSAGDGIVLFGPGSRPAATGATVRNNVIRDNGRNGISVRNGSTGHLIRGNVVEGNTQNGILVAGQNNRILHNRARGNAVLDLSDTNPGGTCDANTWLGNTFATAAPACTQA